MVWRLLHTEIKKKEIAPHAFFMARWDSFVVGFGQRTKRKKTASVLSWPGIDLLLGFGSGTKNKEKKLYLRFLSWHERINLLVDLVRGQKERKPHPFCRGQELTCCWDLVRGQKTKKRNCIFGFLSWHERIYLLVDLVRGQKERKPHPFVVARN